MKEEEEIMSEQDVILRTEQGIFLRFPLSDIPQKKKAAIGVRGIKLGKDDYISDVYLLTNGDGTILEYKGKKLELSNLKLAHRDSKGTKIRV